MRQSHQEWRVLTPGVLINIFIWLPKVHTWVPDS